MNLDPSSGIKEDETVPRYWASARLKHCLNKCSSASQGRLVKLYAA